MLKFKTTDTTGSVEYTVTDSGRNPINLIGCSVYFLMEDAKTKELILNEEATVIDPSKGMIKYQFSDVAMLKNGMFNAEFHIVFTDSKRKIVPSNGYIQISVMRSLDDSKIGSIQEGIIIEVSKIEAFKDEITETIEGFKQEYNGVREATEKAITAADFAKTQGDRAKAEADRLQGTDVSILDQQVRTINEQLSASNRHHQILSDGQHILNGNQNAPLDIQIEGRTLIPMQNTVLDAAKYYVLADKKTSLKWANNTVTHGIAKFSGKAEKPRVIKVTNFEGKVSGSTMENPHVMKRAGNQSTLVPPTGTWQELTSQENNQVSKLDGTTLRQTSINANAIPQKLMSFNLIEEVERTIGRIPRSTVAEKVQWLKDNIARITCNWHGFGSSVAGNKASLANWRADVNQWTIPASHEISTNSMISKVSCAIGNAIPYRVDSNGFVHFLSYAEPTDGTTISDINTDYVELEIELKPAATLYDPCIPLYEVDRTEYDKILANYDESAVLARYPRVQGMQHLQNPYIIAEGENLMPPFYEWTLHANAIVKGPYEVELNATGAYQSSHVRVNVKGNQQYSFFGEGAGGNIWEEKIDGTSNGGFSFVADTQRSFTTKSDTARLRIELTQSASGKFIWKKPMLNLGVAVKPFVPRNPSHLFANIILSQIGDRKDILFRDNGEWKLRREIVRDVVLDGSLPWKLANDLIGIKRISVEVPNSNSLIPANPSMINFNQIATKHDGTALKLFLSVPTEGDQFALFGVTGQAHDKQVYLSVSDTDSGFAESYVPVQNEIKAYFNGWKVKLIDLNGKPTAWQSVVDGKDAPTQTLAYVSTNRAPNYTPYKLSYVLASPVTEVVTEKVEGDIAINGLTQVEVGSGFSYTIDDKGKRLYTKSPIHQRYKETCNAVSIPVSWAGSLKGTVTDVVNKQADDRAQISVNTRLIYDMLIRLKAGGL